MQNINDLIEVLDLINNLEKTNSNSNSKEINDVIKHLIDEYNDNNKDNYNVNYFYFNNKAKKKLNNLFLKNLCKYKKTKINDSFLGCKCSICLEKINLKDYVRKLPVCNHVYHKKCIDNWLKNDINKSCPLCKQSYLKIFKKCENKYLNNKLDHN